MNNNIIKFEDFQNAVSEELVAKISANNGSIISSLGDSILTCEGVPVFHNHRYALIGDAHMVQLISEKVDGVDTYAILVDDYFMRLPNAEKKFVLHHELSHISLNHMEIILDVDYSVTKRFMDASSIEHMMVLEADANVIKRMGISPDIAKRLLISLLKNYMMMFDDLNNSFSDIDDDIMELRESWNTEFNNRLRAV